MRAAPDGRGLWGRFGRVMARLVAVPALCWPWSGPAHGQGLSADAASFGLAPRVYVGLDYLHMWMKNAPLAVPLVSTGSIVATHHGLLGAPINGSDSTILYGSPFAPAVGGNASQSFGGTAGGRLTAGYLLDPAGRSAIEISAFGLSSRSAGYQASGDAAGNPVLNIPVYNTVPYQVGPMTVLPGEDGLPFSLPDDPARARNNGIVTGDIAIQNRIQLWGGQINGRWVLHRDPAWELIGLAGYRHVGLTESFGLRSNLLGVTGPYAGQSGTVFDSFKTRNQFDGLNLGLQLKYRLDRWSFTASTRFAPGVSRQTVAVNGGFVSANFGPFTFGPEGVFAQPSNEGRRSSSRFAFVTESELEIGYAVTKNVTIALSYDHLYYSNVVRPSDQIDRNLPKGQTFLQAAPTISASSPQQRFQTTDFFAHGANLRIRFRF